MKELISIVEKYEQNSNLSIESIVKIFGIKPFKSTYEYIDLIHKQLQKYISVPKNYIFLRFIIFSKIYDINSETSEIYNKLKNRIDNKFLSSFDENIQISKKDLSELRLKYDDIKNNYNSESAIIGLFNDTFKYLDLYFGSTSTKSSKFFKEFFSNFDLKYHITRYFIKHNLYEYSLESGDLRLGRGSVVAKCIPIKGLQANLETNKIITVLNPRNNKTFEIKIIRKHFEDSITYLALINGKEEWITDSNSVYNAYDALHDINKYMFAGYNWKRRELIMK